LPCTGISGLYLNLAEGLFPFVIPLPDDVLEIPAGDLGGDIGEGLLTS
jgi:hypothetical protein